MKPELEMQTSKHDLVSQGYTPLTKEELLKLIANNTVRGDYEYSGHRIYKTFMNANGDMQAKNDWGSEETGRWSVANDGSMSVEWEGYWEDWSALAFKVDDEIKFYDSISGKWRTTFHQIMQGEQDLEV